MKRKRTEKGQALILITFAIVGLIGLTALTVDGGMAYSDRRHAQNAADNSAYAGALAFGRLGRGTNNINIINAANSIASANTYDNDGTSNIVEVDVATAPTGACPNSLDGVDITVTITSNLKTFFAPVVGVEQVTNKVSAVSRACGTYTAPLFDGNAIVSLSPSGTGYGTGGNSTWTVKGSGIFSNSSSCSNGQPSVKITNNATLNLDPGSTITAVGCISGGSGTTGASQYQWSDYSSLLPRTPACNGTAYEQNGKWYPESGADGSNVAFSGDMVFTAGLYCVTNSPGPYHGEITGTGVTFYVKPSNFTLKFNGSGNAFTATAPTSGEYAGVLMYVAPQVSNNTLLQTQDIDMRGNGYGAFSGSIIAPSAQITMKGNSGTTGLESQIIGYSVLGDGGADIYVDYNSAENYQAPKPVTVTLLQ